MLDRGPLPDFWRAMTDNDMGAWKSTMNRARQEAAPDITVWRHAGDAWRVRDIETKRIDASAAQVIVHADLPLVSASYTMTYTIEGAGTVTVAGAYAPGPNPLPMMPRAGMELVVSPGFEHVRWLGRGPAATYADREFERIGVYSSTVADAVGRLLASAGEREQNRRPLDRVDERRRRRPAGDPVRIRSASA